MRPSTYKALSILGIISLGIIVYSNTFLSSFHFDDDAYIVNNFAIRNIRNLVDIWNVCPCRIITFLSIALNYHFHQLNVLGYHLFNMAVHLATALLVWWLLQLTFTTAALKEEKIARQADIISLLAALIFVCHPLQTEAVTYIWQRAASMAAFFYLLSLCFYIRSRLTRGPAHKKYYYLSLIVAVIAMYTKENAITLPLMIIFYEITFIRTKEGFDWTQLYPFWLILFVIPQTMVLTKTSRVQEIRSIVGGPDGITPYHYLLTQFRVMITYLRLLVLPLHQNLDYDYPVYKNIIEIPVLTSLAFLSALVYLAKVLYSKYRLISFSIVWFFLTLLPESSILPQSDVIFEHRMYLPMVGCSIFLVCGAYYLLAKDDLKIMLIVLSLLIAFYSWLTYERNKVWKNEIILWEDIVSKSPHKARPYINRGWAYYNQGNFAQAMSDYDKAISISPEFIYPYDDRGLIYAGQGNYPKAIGEYDRSIKINPYYAKVYYHRALAYFKENDSIQALRDYNKAIEIDPEFVDAYNDRAKLYLSQGNKTMAIVDQARSLKIDPNQSQ